MDYPDSCEAVVLELFKRISDAEEKEDRRKNMPAQRDMLGLMANA
jgi:hypothetical protein